MQAKPSDPQFQCQSGSIKSLDAFCQGLPKQDGFNANLVRLKGVLAGVHVPFIRGFNANLVRLKVEIPSAELARFLRFNANLVRLKVKHRTGNWPG